MSANNVTDLTYLKEISKGDQAFIQDMLDIFLNENPDEVHRLEKAIAEKDYSRIKSISHHMKSTIPFIGLDKHITTELVQIEDLALRQRGTDEISKLFVKVKEVILKAVNELQK